MLAGVRGSVLLYVYVLQLSAVLTTVYLHTTQAGSGVICTTTVENLLSESSKVRLTQNSNKCIPFWEKTKVTN